MTLDIVLIVSIFHGMCVSLVALLYESMPDVYLRARRMSLAGFMAQFMWISLASLLSHAYK